MLVDFRPHARLSSPTTPVTIDESLGPVVGALGESGTDLSRVRVVCDWVQYKQNFRDVVEVRPIVSGTPDAPVPEGVRDDDLEVAVAEWVDWYNHRRLHGEIGHVPPVEYESAYWSTHTVTSYRENPVPANAGTN